MSYIPFTITASLILVGVVLYGLQKLYRKHISSTLLHRHRCTLAESTVHTLCTKKQHCQPWMSVSETAPQLDATVEHVYDFKYNGYKNAGEAFFEIWGYRPSVFRFNHKPNMYHWDMYGACDSTLKMQARIMLEMYPGIMLSVVQQLLDNPDYLKPDQFDNRTASYSNVQNCLGLVVRKINNQYLTAEQMRTVLAIMPHSTTKVLLLKTLRHYVSTLSSCEFLRLVDMVNFILEDFYFNRRQVDDDLSKQLSLVIQDMMGRTNYSKIQHTNVVIRALTGTAAKALVRE